MTDVADYNLTFNIEVFYLRKLLYRTMDYIQEQNGEIEALESIYYGDMEGKVVIVYVFFSNFTSRL